MGTLALPTARPWPEVRLEAELLQYKPHAHERAALAQGGSTRGCQGPGAKPAAPHTRGSASSPLVRRPYSKASGVDYPH